MKRLLIRAKIFCAGLGVYGIIFAGMLGVFGFVNAKKVINFWINDEIDNNEWTVSLGNKGEADYISNFWGKIQFVNLNGLMRNVMGQHEMNGIVKLNNGFLLTTHAYETDEALQNKADCLHLLDSYLDKKDIPMLFAVCPYTSDKYNPQLPTGILDYGNDNIDRFINMVKTYHIDYLDFREEIHNDGMDTYKMMYKTDHHWTTQAGFYAYNKLLPWIQDHTQAIVDAEVSDLSNYTQTTYKNWHLGSRGQRTGSCFAGIDDFVLITPDFDTSICAGDAAGSFIDMLVDKEPLKNKDHAFRYTYDYVLGKSLGNFINNKAENQTRVLLVTDSFGKAVAPYLILSFREVRFIFDADSYRLTNEYIEEYNPDVVILLYYADYIEGDNRGFSFSVN